MPTRSGFLITCEARARQPPRFKASCPAKGAFAMTPPGRLQAITLRLTATLEAVQTVRPAMEAFYNSLSDEQKERFNEIGPKRPTCRRLSGWWPRRRSGQRSREAITPAPSATIDRKEAADAASLFCYFSLQWSAYRGRLVVSGAQSERRSSNPSFIGFNGDMGLRKRSISKDIASNATTKL